MRKFIDQRLLESYDKLFSLGHMTIFRNVDSINKLFMVEWKSQSKNVIKKFQEIARINENKCFDEWPMNQININVLSQQENLRIYNKWPMLDVAPFKSYF